MDQSKQDQEQRQECVQQGPFPNQDQQCMPARSAIGCSMQVGRVGCGVWKVWRFASRVSEAHGIACPLNACHKASQGQQSVTQASNRSHMPAIGHMLCRLFHAAEPSGESHWASPFCLPRGHLFSLPAYHGAARGPPSNHTREPRPPRCCTARARPPRGLHAGSAPPNPAAGRPRPSLAGRRRRNGDARPQR